jgi:hypothetical protein
MFISLFWRNAVSPFVTIEFSERCHFTFVLVFEQFFLSCRSFRWSFFFDFPTLYLLSSLALFQMFTALFQCFLALFQHFILSAFFESCVLLVHGILFILEVLALPLMLLGFGWLLSSDFPFCSVHLLLSLFNSAFEVVTMLVLFCSRCLIKEVWARIRKRRKSFDYLCSSSYWYAASCVFAGEDDFMLS